MAKAELRSASDRIDLDSQVATGFGAQALAGMTGLGLPPVQVQWRDAAGDGATYRARRVLPRDIDIPIDLRTLDKGALVELTSRLARMFSEGCQLVYTDDFGEAWYANVHRTGGGGYVKGRDDRDTELQLVITVRAGDPFWTALEASTTSIGGTPPSSTGFLSALAGLPVTSSQAIGSITIENTGDAEAFPVWTVTGPGNNLEIRLPNGTGFKWLGTLSVGQTLTIDVRSGTILDQSGANRYAQLDTAPRFFRLPPGVTVATASMLDTTTASSITCSWRPRRWMVI